MNPTLTLLLPMALAQAGPFCPPGVPCAPGGLPLVPLPPAPVLAARVIAPEGVKVTLLPGSPEAKVFAAPVTAGFRPGYVYPLELTELPGHPGEALYPVLEVRGSIVPRPGMNPMEFPAPVSITRDDIDKAFAGAVVTKAIYLEDPVKAIPIQSNPDQPIETAEPTEAAALSAATDNGRLVAVLRFGDRKPDPPELARAAIPGTVLLPGEKYLPAPAAPPVFAACPVQLFDPILGPRPSSLECLTDGGDVGPRLGIGPFGRLGGLDPTDVALEYTHLGRRRVKTSNQVCICSPRFAVRRAERSPGGVFANAGPDTLVQYVGKVTAGQQLPPMAVVNRVKPVGFLTRWRLGAMVVVNGAAEFIGLTQPRAVASASGVGVVSMAVGPDEITNVNELCVTKEVEPDRPVQPGEEVTITIRYRNGTKTPVTDLLLSDSLSGRLEYVSGSAQSDRPANVTTTANEAGSVVVRFEIPGPVPAGQSGTVKFKARVR